MVISHERRRFPSALYCFLTRPLNTARNTEPARRFGSNEEGALSARTYRFVVHHGRRWLTVRVQPGTTQHTGHVGQHGGNFGECCGELVGGIGGVGTSEAESFSQSLGFRRDHLDVNFPAHAFCSHKRALTATLLFCFTLELEGGRGKKRPVERKRAAAEQVAASASSDEDRCPARARLSLARAELTRGPRTGPAPRPAPSVPLAPPPLRRRRDRQVALAVAQKERARRAARTPRGVAGQAREKNIAPARRGRRRVARSTLRASDWATIGGGPEPMMPRWDGPLLLRPARPARVSVCVYDCFLPDTARAQFAAGAIVVFAPPLPRHPSRQ